MTQAQLIHDVTIVLVHATFWICFLFVPIVSTFWPWWKTDLGVTVAVKTAAIALILLRTELAWIFGINPQGTALVWLGLVSFAVVPAVVLWRLVIIWTLQKLDPPPTKSGRTSFRADRRLRKERKSNGDSTAGNIV